MSQMLYLWYHRLVQRGRCPALLRHATAGGYRRGMPSFSNRRFAAVLGIACLGLAAAACGSSPSSTTPSASAPASSTSSPLVTGTANVAYASSLQYINEKVIAPAFTMVT